LTPIPVPCNRSTTKAGLSNCGGQPANAKEPQEKLLIVNTLLKTLRRMYREHRSDLGGHVIAFRQRQPRGRRRSASLTGGAPDGLQFGGGVVKLQHNGRIAT